MRKVQAALSLLVVALLCVTAQAEIITDGFQGVFGDAQGSPFGFTEGATSGETVGMGIVATFDNLTVNLAGFVANGDNVTMSDLVLDGFNTCTGSATYTWDFATLEAIPLPQYNTGYGFISGELTLQANTLATSTESITLPGHIFAFLSYNGISILSDGTDGQAIVHAFPSASITAIATVPEPATLACLLTGLATLCVWYRKRK